MKKALIIIIPIILVLCVICAVVVYFVWQSAGNKLTDLQGLLNVSPTAGTVNVTAGANTNDNLNDTTVPADGNTVTSDVCNLLTLDMAKQLLGSDTKLASQNTGNCTYTTLDLDTSAFGMLTMVVSKSNPATARTQFEQAKTLAYGSQTEPVSGLNADAAYFATTMQQLSILKGDSWIIISGVSDKYASEKELALATAALVLR